MKMNGQLDGYRGGRKMKMYYLPETLISYVALMHEHSAKYL